MAWDFPKKSVMGRGGYGPAWTELPAVAICKTGISLNLAFCNAFGIRMGMALQVGKDLEQRKVGFKIVTADEDRAQNYLVLANKGNKSAKSAMRVGAKWPAKLFPDCVGCAYRAQLNPGQRIIEVLLSPENRI